MELSHLGKNCSICNRNDYLPFKCSYCDKIVCIDHKTDHGKECPLHSLHFNSDLDQASSKLESLREACDYCHKITLKLELVECSKCNHFHCLYHRHQVQHDCKQMKEDDMSRKLENEAKISKQREALDKLKQLTSVTTKHPSNQPSSSTTNTISTDPKKRDLARRIRLMRIKQSCRGPPNVLQEDKIYFEIRFIHQPKSTLSSESNNNKTLKIFTTKKHSLGRMIDWSADELDLKNKNHLDSCDQLVFKKQKNDHSSEYQTLDNQKSFSDYIEDQTLEDGDEILLTYQIQG